MALNLNNLKNGVSSQSCGSGDLPVSQRIEVVPARTTSCQQTGPIDPSREATGITVMNFVRKVCGIIKLHVDNSSSAAGAATFALGGPIGVGEVAANYDAYFTTWDGFSTAAFLVNIVDGLATPAGSTNGNAYGAQIVNTFVGGGEALFITSMELVRSDLSVAPNLAMSNIPVKIFGIGSSTNYSLDTAGGSFFAEQTNIGSSSTSVNLKWTFGCEGIPLTKTTGLQIEIPAGFEGDLQFCVGAVQGNVDFVEGC